MTNLQRIRSMGDDELTEFIRLADCCPKDAFTGCPQYENCHACWKAWLEEECEEDG